MERGREGEIEWEGGREGRRERERERQRRKSAGGREKGGEIESETH